MKEKAVKESENKKNHYFIRSDISLILLQKISDK